MFTETIRLTTDWLKDATYGVAAKLTALTYDGSDVKPTGTLTIVDETRDAQAALGQYAADWAMIVAANPVDVLVGQSATYTHDGDVPILIRLKRTDVATAAATRDLYNTLRATVRSLEALFGTSASAVTARTRNLVQAYAYEALGAARTQEKLEDNAVTAAIAVTIKVRDLTTA